MHTDDLFKEHGRHYIMRPEFLLNVIALAPSVVEVRKAYENVFPTLLSVKLSGRMHEDTFHGLLEKGKGSVRVRRATAPCGDGLAVQPS